MNVPCDQNARVDAHFAGRLSPPAEQRLRVHLESCLECRDRYDRQVMLTRYLPGATSPKERLRQALGLTRRGPRARPWWWVGIAAPVALAVTVVIWTRLPAEADGFTARGAAAPALVVETLAADGTLRTVSGRIHAGDEVVFRYHNANRRPWLMIFGVDASGAIRWYHPAWTDPSQDPAAVPTQPTAALVLLPEAVVHPLVPGRMTLHLVLSDTRLHVRQVERLIGTRGQWPAGTEVSTHTLEVLP